MGFDQKLRTNIASLFSLQIVNYLVPLITLPWLTRVLGPSGYGQVGFVMAVAAYLVILVDYGFNLSATQKIAVHQQDKERCSEIFWATLGAKALLGVAALILLLLLIALVPRFGDLAPLLLIGYICVLGSIVTPVWFYQGMERMKGFAAVNATIKALSVPLVFIFVHGPDDIITAVTIQAGVIGLSGLINFTALVAAKEVTRPAIGIGDVLRAMRDGAGLFLAQAGVSLYTAANLVILGLIAPLEEVGYFAAAMAVMRAVHGMLTPVTNAVFPHVSHLMAHKRADGLRFVRALAKSLTLAASIMAMALFMAAPIIVNLLFGAAFAPAAAVLQWLAPTVVIIVMSNLLGVQTMLPLGRERAFTGILLSAGVLNIILILPLSFYFGAVGAAASVFATELCVVLFMAIYLWRNCPETFRVEGGNECRV